MEWERVVNERLIDLKQKKLVLEELIITAVHDNGKRRIREAIKETERLIVANQEFLLTFHQGVLH